MNLLPRSHKDFSSKLYWEEFFKKRTNSFEWYGEYVDLCGVLHKYCKIEDNILMIGCGNSKLSEDLYDVGHQNVINIDISDVVIKQMTARNKTKRPKMKYISMDVKNMNFKDDEFHVIIDKGTLDALFTENNNENISEICKMFDELYRVLRSGGRYICITLGQAHILDQVFKHFPQSWFVRVHRIDITNNEESSGMGSKLPVFAFVFTKMKIKLVKPVLEMIDSEKSNVEKFESVDKIKTHIQDLQRYAVIRNKLEQSSIQDDLVTVDLWSSTTDFKEPRYSLKIVDTELAKLSSYNGPFAVFIVPQGREIEGAFSTEFGLRNLAVMAGFTRLIVATLHRGHFYRDLDEIKADLSGKVMELAPNDLKQKLQVPFLTTSSDIGTRELLEEGCLLKIGNFAVEEVKSPEDYYCRQMVFLKTPNTVQSQARLMIDKSSKKKAKLKLRIPDHRYLMEEHHKAVLLGLSLLQFNVQEEWSLLIFGARNCCLISFLLAALPKVTVTCVEEHDKMLDIAVRWFSLPIDNKRLSLVKDLNDEDFTNMKEGCYDMVIFFDKILQEDNEILKSSHSLLRKGGVLALRTYHEIINEDQCSGMTQYFPVIFSSTVQDDTQLLYCIKDAKNKSDSIKEKSAQNVTIFIDFIREQRKGFYDNTYWNVLSDYLEDLFEIS